MLEELLAKVNSIEFEESEGWVNIESINWHAPSCVELELKILCNESESENWQVSCDLVLSHSILSRSHGTLAITMDHPVLWPHISSYAQLYFSSCPENAAAVFGSLLETQLNLVGTWFPITRFINRSVSTIGLLSSGNGLLATGPMPLIEGFQTVLNAYGVCNNILPLQFGRITCNSALKPRALVFDDSYVAAHSIEANKRRRL